MKKITLYIGMEMIKLKLGPAWPCLAQELCRVVDTLCFHFFWMCDKVEAGTGACLD